MNFPAGITDTERALIASARIVVLHGDKYGWVMDRIERQLEMENSGSQHRQRALSIVRQLTREVRNASAG